MRPVAGLRTGTWVQMHNRQADFPRTVLLPHGYSEQRRNRELRLYEGDHCRWPQREGRMGQDGEKVGGFRAHSFLRLRARGTQALEREHWKDGRQGVVRRGAVTVIDSQRSAMWGREEPGTLHVDAAIAKSKGRKSDKVERGIPRDLRDLSTWGRVYRAGKGSQQRGKTEEQDTSSCKPCVRGTWGRGQENCREARTGRNTQDPAGRAKHCGGIHRRQRKRDMKPDRGRDRPDEGGGQ